MKTIYRKVFINSPADLPENGTYIVHFKNSHPQLVELNKNSIFSKDNDYWLENIDWYLQPVELPSDEEIEKEAIKAMQREEGNIILIIDSPYSSASAFIDGANCYRDKLINK